MLLRVFLTDEDVQMDNNNRMIVLETSASGYLNPPSKASGIAVALFQLRFFIWLQAVRHIRRVSMTGHQPWMPYASTSKMGIKIPCQSSPARFLALFTCRDLPALSAELHHAPVLEEVHP